MQPTLFDLYAAAALQGIIAHDGTHGDTTVRQAFDVARAAIKMREGAMPDDDDPDPDDELI